MKRRDFSTSIATGALLFAAIFSSLMATGTAAASPSSIIPVTTCERNGLTRQWMAQVTLDRSRARVSDVVLHDDAVYVLTTSAIVHALNAETGETMWSRQIGRPEHPSMTPGISKDLLGLVNGSRLYVVNRYNGDLLYETQVKGAPGAGCGMSEKRAYVPMTNGLIVAYRLEPLTDPMTELGMQPIDPSEEQIKQMEIDRRENLRLREEFIPPLACQSHGRALVQPLATIENRGEEFVAWPTDRGYLHIGWVDRRMEDRLTVKYRLTTDGEIVAKPTYLPCDPNDPKGSGTLFISSADGFVYAVADRSGEQVWRYSAGDPITEPAVVVDENVYVTTQVGGMHCVESATGIRRWWSPRINRFISASPTRVYAEDRMGRIVVLNAETGAHLGVINSEQIEIKLANNQNDRIYLASDTGLIQCIRELELDEPQNYIAMRMERLRKEENPDIIIDDDPTGQPDGQPSENAPAEDPFADGENPFSAGGGAADPFGGGGAADPFGGAGQPADGGGAETRFIPRYFEDNTGRSTGQGIGEKSTALKSPPFTSISSSIIAGIRPV